MQKKEVMTKMKKISKLDMKDKIEKILSGFLHGKLSEINSIVSVFIVDNNVTIKAINCFTPAEKNMIKDD